jgi:ubiquinone/menaquinone biosynthesis C-methylase UbiE
MPIQSEFMVDRESNDLWSRWLLHQWHGGDERYHQVLRWQLMKVRDRVLAGAQLVAGNVLLDVGSGDGLIGLGAIEREPSVQVSFVDLSAALLEHLKKAVHDRGLQGQCSFIQATAERLEGIGNSTADAVATRACLAYVADKPAALAEFRRVLKPGGRLSIAEPIFQDHALETLAIGNLIASQPAHANDRFVRLYHRLRSAQLPASEQAIAQNPLTNFSERDLFHLVHQAGFQSVRLELMLEYKPPLNVSWDVFLDISPHPWAPSPREILDLRFSAEERKIFENGLRPQIEGATVISSDPVAFITAWK